VTWSLGLPWAALALLAGYAGLERGLRHQRLARWLLTLDESAPFTLSSVLVLLGGLGVLVVPWSLVSAEPRLMHLAAGVGLVLAWNAATRDHDPVARGPSGVLRLGLCALAILSFWTPLGLLLTALLLSARFGFWQHHAAFPMRLHLFLVAYAGLAAISKAFGPWRELEPALLVVLLTLFVSHYVITALAKIWLGPRPWSWMLNNRLHFLAASAYSWGWARFVPWPVYRRGVAALRRVEVPLQIATFLLELTCPLALFDPRLAAGYAFTFAGFHVGVWLVSGLCFWDWLLTDLLIGWYLLAEPAGLGLPALALSLALLVLFPLRHKLWKPMPLGWYDTPLTQRVHWYVLGASGREYRLDNGFMCPHERLYGKVHASFAVDTEVLTYHLGECFLPELRDAIVQAGPDPTALAEVRRRFGIRPWSEALTRDHVRYLQAFFARLNQGAQKFALPSWARLLKAPGDQMFYWGDGVAYRRQEAVRRVRLVFREEYFDGQDLVRLRDQELLDFEVPPAPELAPSPLPEQTLRKPTLREPTLREPTLREPTLRELTPREMDDYLLGIADGRLIRTSGVRQRYVSGDDGAHVE